MEQTSGDSGANSEFTFDPTNKIVGIIDDAGDAQAALRDLRLAGFTAKEVGLLTDEEGARRFDMSDERQAVAVHIFRPAQKPPTYYDAPGLIERVEKELLDGHYFIGVYAKESESQGRAREILKSHGGPFINFYGRLAAEALEP